MKRLISLISLAALLICLSTTVFAADTYVSDMDLTCDVQKNGSCKITLAVTVCFDSTVDSVRIPVGTNASSVTASGGSFVTRVIDGCTWVILKNAAGTSGVRNYVVSYTVKNAVVISDGAQKLDIPLLCPYWDWRVDNLHFKVELPKEFTGSPTYISGYYGDNIAVRDTVTETAIEGTVLSAIMDQESVDLVLSLPSGYCRIWHQPGSWNGFCVAMILLITLIAAGYWLFTLRNPMAGSVEQRQPPNGVGAWEFPYVAGSANPDIAVLIFEWANMGYLSIRQNARGRVTLRKEMEMGPERREYEQRAFSELFARADDCPGDTAAFRKIIAKAADASMEYWNTRLFAPTSGNPALLHLAVALVLGFAWMRCMDYLLPAWLFRALLIIPMLPVGFGAGYILQLALQNALRKDYSLVLPGAAIVGISFLLINKAGGAVFPVLALALQVLSALLTYRGGKRSQAGMDMIAQIRAFKKELNGIDSHELQLILNADPQYYFRMLPYAETCGIASAFSDHFEHTRLESCPWFHFDGAEYRTAADFYPYYKDMLRRIRRGRRAKNIKK